MCIVRHLSISLALATAVTGALADEGLTRAQVRAETLAAQRAGEIPRGDLDIKPAVARPDLYPPKAPVVGETRAQVRADLAHAVASGDVLVGDSGQTLREIDPQRYPPQVEEQGLTRAQVLRELARAKRLGDIQQGEEGRTFAELFPQRYAAARIADEATTRRYASK